MALQPWANLTDCNQHMATMVPVLDSFVRFDSMAVVLSSCGNVDFHVIFGCQGQGSQQQYCGVGYAAPDIGTKYNYVGGDLAVDGSATRRLLSSLPTCGSTYATVYNAGSYKSYNERTGWLQSVWVDW